MEHKTPCIRKAKKTDFDGIIRVLNQLSSTNITRPKLERMLATLNVRIYVAVDQSSGSIVGTACLFVRPTLLYSDSSVGYIEEVVVDEQHRGAGIGTVLVQHVLDVAKTNFDCYKCVLQARLDAVGFYKRLGFYERDVGMCIYF